MKNLIHLIVRFHFTILFLLFEIICLILIVNYNNYQKSTFINSNNSISGNIYRKVSSITDYLSLAKTNEELSRENARLNNLMFDSFKEASDSSYLFKDSVYQQQYIYREAKIINNTVNKHLNYITLDKGSLHGIEPEMAVITPNGVVGVVKGVSKNYSSVISLLNSRLKVSAKLKKNTYYGSLSWDGKNYRRAKLSQIPFHVPVQIGDTVVTNSFSAIFPEGVMLGTVDEILPTAGSNFQEIMVLLSNDFKSLSYVYVVGDLFKKERLELEKGGEK